MVKVNKIVSKVVKSLPKRNSLVKPIVKKVKNILSSKGISKLNENDKNNLHTILKSSYEKKSQAEKSLASKGYKLDKELSGRRAKVFTDKDGNPHVVYRGTSNLGDIITDAKLLIGQGNKTKRVQHSKKVHSEVEQKYGKPVHTYGHSLGGYLAERVGAKGTVTTYNKASIGEKIKNPNQIDIRSKTDIVSVLTPKSGGTKVIEIKGSVDPLKAHNLDTLKNASAFNSLGPSPP